MSDINMDAHTENEHSAIRELLTLAAAGALDAVEQRQVEEHLLRCDACRAEFRGLGRLAKSLQEQPMPQMPPGLMQQTRRLLELRAQAQRSHTHQARRWNRLMFGALALLGWTLTLLNWPLLRMLDRPLMQTFNVSSTQLTVLWTTYILAAWLATALAAAVLGKRFRQEERAL